MEFLFHLLNPVSWNTVNHPLRVAYRIRERTYSVLYVNGGLQLVPLTGVFRPLDVMPRSQSRKYAWIVACENLANKVHNLNET